MGRFGRTSLLAFILLFGAITSVSCQGGAESTSPAATATATIPAPTQTATSTVAQRPITVPTQVPAVGDGSLQVISSRAALVPSQLDPAKAAGILLSPATQVRIGGEGGLTISANGSVTVAADEAYIVVTPPPNFGLRGIPQGMASKDRAEVIAKLVEIGIAEDDIEFPQDFRFGPGSVSVSVEVKVTDLPEIGDLVLNAVEDVLGRSEVRG